MFHLLVFISLLLSAMTGNAQPNTPDISTLSVTISADNSAFDDGMPITFSLTNISSETVRVLKWGTPLENGFSYDMFEVWQDTRRVAYTGRYIKRGQPQASDFITLQPNESISQNLDIADGYGVYDAGDYRVSFNSMVTIIKTDEFPVDNTTVVSPDRTHIINLKSETIMSHLYFYRFEIATKLTPDFFSCTNTQRNILNQALTQAEIIAEESANALAFTPELQRRNAPRYSNWFGTYTSARYKTISNNFNRIHDVIANRQIAFDCTCNISGIDPANVFAFIEIPFRYYQIHLCGQFWNTNMTGVDSKAGTIIHEISHFNIVANTTDNNSALNPFGAQRLAQTIPNAAIVNANNHEYFAENTPTLPMEITRLSLNQDFTNQIAENTWLYYKVTGASKITLSNMSKDFDLFVKADSIPSFSDFDCRPFLLGTDAETCDITNTGTYFIGIKSYSRNLIVSIGGGGTFTLLAEGDTTPTNNTLPFLELGTITANHRWSALSVPTNISKPLVLLGPPTTKGSQAGVMQVRNEQNNAAINVRFREWKKDFLHATESIDYMMVEEGVHRFADGTILQVSRFPVSGTNQWKTVAFNQSFVGKPRVFVMLQTARGGDTATLRIKDINTGTFKVALFEQEKTFHSGHIQEEAAYFAFYHPLDRGFIVENNTAVTYSLRSTQANHRWRFLLDSSISAIRIQEEKSKDNETFHALEAVEILQLDGRLFAQISSFKGKDTSALRRQ
jgi:peptidyl-Lys metalloendopeptidase